MSSTVPVVRADLHRFAHFERLVDGDDDRAENVGEGVLRREGEGQAADAEAGEQRLHIGAEALHRQQHAEDDEDRRPGSS